MNGWDRDVFWCIKWDGEYLASLRTHSVTVYASERKRFPTKAAAMSAIWSLRHDRRGQDETYSLVRVRAAAKVQR